MTDPVDAALLQLQREYLGSMPARLDELRADIAALGSGAEAELSLRDRLHRLAGSGGSYGFWSSALSRGRRSAGSPPPGRADTAGLSALVERLGAAVRTAEAQLAEWPRERSRR